MIKEKLIREKRDLLQNLLDDRVLTSEINLQTKQKTRLRIKIETLNWVLDGDAVQKDSESGGKDGKD